jgi:hypothetical protein
VTRGAEGVDTGTSLEKVGIPSDETARDQGDEERKPVIQDGDLPRMATFHENGW